MRFTGHETDMNAQSGSPLQDDLTYMHARHFSAVTGRFLSVDAFGGGQRSPQSWNRYSYVLGNPLKFVDPLGFCASINGIRIDDCSTTVTGSYINDSSGIADFFGAGNWYQSGFGSAGQYSFSRDYGRGGSFFATGTDLLTLAP